MARTKVQSELIATNAISGTIIADGAITSTHLAANCVDSSELVTGSIDTIHIAANQVTATKIVTNGVLTRHISDDQVTAAKLANSINTDIATGPAALPKAGGTMTGNIAHASNFTIDVGGTIDLDSDGGQIKLSDAGTQIGLIQMDSGQNLIFRSMVSDKDILIKGNDGSSTITAVTFDMSDAGSAYFNNKVGIGTDSLSAPLEVRCDSNNRGISIVEQGVGTETWKLGVNTDGDLIFLDSTDTTASVTFQDGTGYVGIGTASPTEKLHVFNSSQSWNQYANIRMSTESDSYAAEIGFHRGTSDDSDRGLFLSGDGSTKHVRVLHGGNVGIGMTSPQRKFEVSTANAEMSHFGQIAGTNGHYTGITLGYREDNINYRKAGIIQEQIGDSAARGHLHLCVDTGADNNSIDVADSKLMIHGTSGNVGIGTTSPAKPLHLKVASGWATTRLEGASDSGGELEFYATSTKKGSIWFGNDASFNLRVADTNAFSITSGRQVKVYNAGNVALDALKGSRFGYSTSYKCVVVGGAGTTTSDNVAIGYDPSGNASGSFTGYGEAVYFRNNVQLRTPNSSNNAWYNMMTFKDGVVVLNETINAGMSNNNPSARYGFSFGGGQQVSSTNNDTNLILNMSNGSSNAHVLFRSDGGNTGSITTNGSAVAFNTGSDYRLKENVLPLKDGLDRVNKLKPVQFDWKKSQETDEGFIAHEVQEIVPYVVKGEKDGEKIQTMDYGKLTPLLVKAIQEQQTIIDDLKSRIATLEG